MSLTYGDFHVNLICIKYEKLERSLVGDDLTIIF